MRELNIESVCKISWSGPFKESHVITFQRDLGWMHMKQKQPLPIHTIPYHTIPITILHSTTHTYHIELRTIQYHVMFEGCADADADVAPPPPSAE